MSLILTNRQPCSDELWQTFLDTLDTTVDEGGCDAETLRWSTEILIYHRVFENVDLEKTLTSFQERGGYCDCEVLMNVVDRELEHEEGKE